MSEERSHIDGENPDWINRSYQDWDAGTAGDDLWERLDESLSLDAIWNRVDQSLAQEERAPDNRLQESYENWDPGTPTDQWSKLDEALSLEQVWTGLDHTLNKPISLVTPLWKFIAASIAALFMVTRMNDAPVSKTNSYSIVTFSAKTAVISSPSAAVNAPVEMVNPVFVAETVKPTGDGGSSYAVKSPVTPVKWVSTPTSASTPASRPALAVINPASTTTTGVILPARIVTEAVVNLTPPVTSVILPLETAALLPKKLLETGERQPIDPQYDFRRKVPYHHWTVQFGSQLSYLVEDHQSTLTSIAPKLSLAADFSYRHRIGSVQLIHGFGISQYSQGAGKYVNGRYQNTTQHVNALQLTSSLAYSFRRTTIYGGILFSKIINGLEERYNTEQKTVTVTKVYNNRPVQPGATFGIDYRVLAFPSSGKHISVGGQYQWIPGIKGQHASFDQMQGVRLQLKFSF